MTTTCVGLHGFRGLHVSRLCVCVLGGGFEMGSVLYGRANNYSL